jgi:hypothetical protein
MIIDGTNGLTFNDSSTQTKGVSSVNPVFTGDATINGLTVGKGASAIASNTAFGLEPLFSNTSGSFNTAVGRYALYSNTTGANNAALGRALISNTTGGQNTAVGLALNANTTASDNTAVGYQSAHLNTTGANNVAIGKDALYSNTTASYNTAVGYQAGYSNTTGASNTFVGQYAGYSSTGTSNTFVGGGGTAACAYYMTTGSKNTILGGYSGNQGGLDIRTASNYIVLSDGDGNPRGYFNNSGNFVVAAGIISDGNYIWNRADGSGKGFLLGSSGSANGLISQTSGGSGTTTTYIGNAAITAVSDIRLKENVVDSNRNAINILNQLRVVEHTWNDPSDQCENNRNSRGVWTGLIAQEAQPIIPWLVNKPLEDVDAKGNPQYWNMDYGYAVPLLIKAIQELNAKITALENK